MTDPTGKSHNVTPAMPRKHEWEMVAGFALALPKDMPAQGECVLIPLAQTLESYGMSKDFIKEMCAEVERNGEDLRALCEEGKLGCVNIRVQMGTQSLRNATTSKLPWHFYLIKQIMSSESDSLGGYSDPCCYIDLYVYQQED